MLSWFPSLSFLPDKRHLSDSSPVENDRIIIPYSRLWNNKTGTVPSYGTVPVNSAGSGRPSTVPGLLQLLFFCQTMIAATVHATTWIMAKISGIARIGIPISLRI